MTTFCIRMILFYSANKVLPLLKMFFVTPTKLASFEVIFVKDLVFN